MPTRKSPEETTNQSTFSYTPLLVSLLVISAFVNGMFINKFKTMEKAQVAVTPAAPQAPQAPETPTITMDTLKGLFTSENITFGNKNSKNIFVEVADPSCPYCSIAGGLNPDLNKQAGQQFLLKDQGGTYVPPVPEMKKLLDEGKAAFVWIYTNGHNNGEMGAKALYCAHDNGKFWNAHDKLMSAEGYALLNDVVRNDKTKSQELATFLADVMDPTEMKKCLDSGKYDTRLTQNSATATKIGVRGTPGFYINTTSFAGAYSWDAMKSAVK